MNMVKYSESVQQEMYFADMCDANFVMTFYI